MKPKEKNECLRCGYGWTSKSKLFKVSCPSCGTKTINKNNKYKRLIL